VGRTSVAGGEFWQARAMLSLAKAARVLDDPRIESALSRGLPYLIESPAPSDVRALHVLAALEMCRDGARQELRPVMSTWCDEIVACASDGVLMNSSMERGEPHLWAHFQESALAKASGVLHRPELLEVAARSADRLFIDIIDTRFDRPLTSPFDVATTYDVMRRLAKAQGDPKYATLADEALDWFNGRNPAGRPVYDRVKGRVADGIDEGTLNDHSGAESNIVGAQTLLIEVASGAPHWALAEVRGPAPQ
jgi:hypothetical protein